LTGSQTAEEAARQRLLEVDGSGSETPPTYAEAITEEDTSAYSAGGSTTPPATDGSQSPLFTALSDTLDKFSSSPASSKSTFTWD
jgi:hypothetical protein